MPAWNCLQATPNSLAFFLEYFRASESNLKTRNQLTSSPGDEISRRCERKLKVVNLKRWQKQANSFEIGCISIMLT